MDQAPPKRPKIAASLADATLEVERAATDLHHLNIGPGDDLVAAWRADGLELPDIDRMRRYRMDRVQAQMRLMGYDGALLMDPMNSHKKFCGIVLRARTGFRCQGRLKLR